MVYTATVAPGVTFWDAGEFLAAVETLGIPHPPGTPLYILLARVWRFLFFWLTTAAAVNLFSAACTAVAGGITAAFVLRWTGSRLAAIAAALVAGTMSSVWSSATEAEVYAPSLLLAWLLLAIADRVGRIEAGNARWLALAAYLVGLAVPLHLSSLVALPAAVLFVALPSVSGSIGAPGFHERGDERVRNGVALLAAALLVLGVARGSWALAGAAILVAIGSASRLPWPRASTRAHQRATRAGTAAALIGAAIIGLSVIFVMLVRARHDPAINQGDPSTLAALLDVVTRQQYAVAPLWPRQAPIWIQLGNVLEYADWQVALSLAPGVAPSWMRTPVTILFVVFGIIGAFAHRARDRRSWRAMALLLLSASIGVVAYLNLKAGASFGYGVLPDGAAHEARERDYFFGLAFWTWGLWAGIGIAEVARRVAPVWRPIVLATACLPVVLNWRSMNRRVEPAASLPLGVAMGLLQSAPPRATLFVAGDNDSYPLWYAQQVEGVRRDVVVVTLPLLAAPWYRRELARRWQLMDSADVEQWRGEGATARHVAGKAMAMQRPVVASVTVPASRRFDLISGSSAAEFWQLRGMVYAHVRGSSEEPVDRAHTARIAALLAPRLSSSLSAKTTDPTGRWMQEWMRCASWRLTQPSEAAARLLDSRCNRR